MDLFECPICFGDMVDRVPRCLICLHSFCSECLVPLVDDGKITCPTCREVTELRNNDVKELKVNFMLAQMKERERKEPVAPSNVQLSRTVCQICQQQDPVFKCKECLQSMCKHCRVKHDEFEQFKSHSISELCEKHQEAVSYMCTECAIPLCMRCMLLDHTMHKEHCLPYQEAVKKQQDDIKVMIKDIKDMAVSTEEQHKVCSNTYKDVLQREQELLSHKTKLAQKMDKVDDLLRTTALKKDEYNCLDNCYSETKAECVFVMASLNSIITDPTSICQKYPKIKNKAQETIKKVKCLSLDYGGLPFITADPCDCLIVKQLKISKLLLHLKPSNEIDCGIQAYVIKDNVLFLNCKMPRHLVQLGMDGKLKHRYQPNDGKNFVGFTVFDGEIYAIQPSLITKFSIDSGNIVQLYRPDIKNMSKMVLVDKTTFIITDNTRNGKIYEYNITKNITRTLVTGLNQPWHITKMELKEGQRYVVNEYGTHSMRVFDKHWKELCRFGGKGSKDGQFIYPCGIAVTDMDTLLIADAGNSRISHYTVDGKLISHLITKVDDLYAPNGIAYKAPYLWVCKSTKYTKCYQLE